MTFLKYIRQCTAGALQKTVEVEVLRGKQLEEEQTFMHVTTQLAAASGWGSQGERVCQSLQRQLKLYLTTDEELTINHRKWSK